MKSNPISWFEIYVKDMARALKFYQAVLRVELEKLEVPGPEKHAFPRTAEFYTFPRSEDAPGASGALVKMKGFSPGGNSTLVYFSCDDCAVEVGRVAAAGGCIQQEKTSIGPYGCFALAVDTEGNMFGLFSMK